jgi:hypothetical protein
MSRLAGQGTPPVNDPLAGNDFGAACQTSSVKRADYAQAAAMLRRLLAAVDEGTLTVGTLNGIALVRRMEGAAVAFETAAGDVFGLNDDPISSRTY